MLRTLAVGVLLGSFCFGASILNSNVVDTTQYRVTTFASAKNAAQISHQMGFKSVLVVSQYFHIPRSRLALERFQISSVHSAHAEFFEWRDVYSSLRETAGYAAYLLRRSN